MVYPPPPPAQGLADELCERRVVHRITLRGRSPVNHRGESFSLTHTTAPSQGGLFEAVFDDSDSRSTKQEAAQ